MDSIMFPAALMIGAVALGVVCAVLFFSLKLALHALLCLGSASYCDLRGAAHHGSMPAEKSVARAGSVVAASRWVLGALVAASICLGGAAFGSPVPSSSGEIYLRVLPLTLCLTAIVAVAAFASVWQRARRAERIF